MFWGFCNFYLLFNILELMLFFFRIFYCFDCYGDRYSINEYDLMLKNWGLDKI